jgi:hypothetical protein
MKAAAKHFNRQSRIPPRNEGSPLGRRFIILLLAVMLISSFSVAAVSGDDQPNIGVVRVYAFKTPNQVAPASVYSVSIGVNYELRPDNATIHAAIYSGSVNLSGPAWQSNDVIVHGGGDLVWNATLTAPPTEGYFNLTAFAFFLDQGRWVYYNNSFSGPGFVEETIKVSKSASLQIELGIPGLPVKVSDTDVKTSPNGEAQLTLPVGNQYEVTLPNTFDFQNSTRVVFNGWSDSNNQTQRSVILNGDLKLTGTYKVQYLLQLNSPLSSNATWYDSGSIARVHTYSSIPMNWPLGLLGLKYDFVEWSGSVNSQATQLNVTMDAPKTLNANFSVNYNSAFVPLIIVVGIVGAVVVPLMRRRSKVSEVTIPEPTPVQQVPGEQAPAAELPEAKESELVCKKCGDDIEKDWTFCIHCGQKLAVPSQ